MRIPRYVFTIFSPNTHYVFFRRFIVKIIFLSNPANKVFCLTLQETKPNYILVWVVLHKDFYLWDIEVGNQLLCISTSECMLAHAFALSKTMKTLENYEKCTFFIMHRRGSRKADTKPHNRSKMQKHYPLLRRL